MDRGDWIQLLVIASVFVVVILLIFSYINWSLPVSISLTVLILVIGYFINKYVKL